VAPFGNEGERRKGKVRVREGAGRGKGCLSTWLWVRHPCAKLIQHYLHCHGTSTP